MSKLRKTRTMQKTSEEGTEFLKSAWGEDKLEKVQKNIEARHEALESEKVDEEKHDEAEAEAEVPKKKPKLAKHTTMAVTAAEGKTLIADAEIDTDAKTRNQSKVIKELTTAPVEAATSSRGKRKAPLKKQNTMKATAKEGKALLKGTGKLDTTRGKTKKAKANASKKPKLTKSRTMEQTAKEGKAYVKAQNAKKKK